jgi:hypothetical protein
VLAHTDSGGAPDLARSPGAGCEAVVPCGGAVVGTWKIESGCLRTDVPSTGSVCQPFTVVGAPSFVGEFALESTGSYSSVVTITSSSKGTYSTACLVQMGVTCSQLNSAFAQPAGVQTGTCTSSPSGDCDCSVDFRSTSTEQGAYSMSGSTLTMTPQGSASPTVADYCVQGNTLRIRTVETSSAGSAIFDVVAIKQ